MAVSRTLSIADATAAAPGAAQVSALDARLTGLSARSRRALHAVRAAIDQHRPQLAERLLARAHSAAGDHPEYLRLLGIVHHMQKRRPEALAALRHAAERKPADALIMTNLGSALRASGEIAAAEVALLRACELAPDLAAAWYNFGRVIAASGRADEALEVYARALACEPNHVNARIGLADTLRGSGQMKRAATEYRRAIAQSPGSARIWARLVNLRGVALDADETARLEQLHANPDLETGDRIIAGFALGKVLEHANRHAEAFTVFSAANAEKRRRTVWNAAAFGGSIETVRQVFERPPTTTADTDCGSDVIFLVGLPCSGAIVAEHSLTSHPDIAGAWELPDLREVVDEESNRLGLAFSTWASRASAADWRRLGERYLDRSAHRRRPNTRIVDRELSNWSLIGAIAAMLPGARIVNCRTNPIEACLSCYFRLFPRGQEFSYDIPELAAYWRANDRLMRFWRARFPHRIHDHELEEATADPETEVRRLLQFCGLPFDPACLSAHRIPRMPLTTGSRAPRGRAAGYEPLLLPLRAALGLDFSDRSLRSSAA